MIELHCFGESGASYKAALTLEMSGLPWSKTYVDFFGGEARSADYKAQNPMAEVPMMRDGDYTLSQSGAILHYVAEKSGKFGGETLAQRMEVLRWILWDNHKLSGVAGPVRFLANFLEATKRPQEVISFQKARLKTAYATLNAHLASRDWIVGNSVTIADCSLCGYLYYPEPFGFERADWPNIDAWLTRISTLPNWKHPYDLMFAPTVGHKKWS